MTLPIALLNEDRRTREVGTLVVERPTGRAPLPLERVSLTARVVERVAEVEVVQTFSNGFAEPLEAVYIFPLSGGAAVTRFELTVAGRTIVGTVAERQAARQQYTEAIQAGHRAALLEQERDDVFTVQVGNLPPGETAEVRIVYAESLPFFSDGTTELRLPTVVAPRYIAGNPVDRDSVGDGVEADTDRVPDASRITPPRLAPGFDPKVGLSISVEFNGGDLEELACSQHATKLGLSNGGARVSLALENEPLNRDFVLRWKSAGGEIQPSVKVFTSESGERHALLTLTPPVGAKAVAIPRDVVFLVDRSGSMGGGKMTSAIRASLGLLGTLTRRDRFALLAFDDRMDWFENGAFRVADEEGLAVGEKWLRDVDARGGTELTGALSTALKAVANRGADAHRMPILVLLTDGEVGDESSAMKEVQRNLGDARLFTVGIDTAVNDGFLRRLASLGGGTATFVVPGEQLESALRGVGREIGRPVLTDLRAVEAETGENVAMLTPAPIPDLFVGRPVAAFFKIGNGNTIRVTGKLPDGTAWERTLPVEESGLPALANLWARRRITDLEDQFRLKPQRHAEIQKEIVELSVRHSVLTRFTAFLVVDKAEVVNKGGNQMSVVQPVEMPAQWEMDQMLNTVPFAPTVAGGYPAMQPIMMPSPAMMPPGAPPQARSAAPPAKSKAGGLFKRAINAFSGKSAEMDEPEYERAITMPPDQKAERAEFTTRFAELASLFEETALAILEKKPVNATALDAARKAAVAAVNVLQDAAELTETQRFLRSALPGFIAALNASPDDAETLIAEIEAQLKKANEEIAARFGGGQPSGGGGFWSGSI